MAGVSGKGQMLTSLRMVAEFPQIPSSHRWRRTTSKPLARLRTRPDCMGDARALLGSLVRPQRVRSRRIAPGLPGSIQASTLQRLKVELEVCSSPVRRC